jgi:DNA-binding NarL/FixJ family response regulator
MKIRLLLAVASDQCSELLHSMLESAMHLVPLDVEVSHTRTRDALIEQVLANAADVVFVDWDLAHEDTPNLVHEIAAANAQMRIVALLPLQLRQYRQSVWEAGACSSVPKEHMDQEWLSSVLCLMHRAMCREARLLAHTPA